MINLGNVDPEVDPSAIAAYLETVKKVTRQDWGKQLRGEQANVWMPLEPSKERNELKVKEVQQVLRDAEFLPNGKVDGIFGYRSRSAIRLFQEYVRTIEKEENIIPDGVVDSKTFAHLKRWAANNLKADWTGTFQTWKNGFVGSEQTEYQTWLDFLNNVKQSNLANPNRMLRMVNEYQKDSDSVKVKDWDFDPKHIHLVGIRRKGKPTDLTKFDDVIILLIKGLVFKFQGSTDPGHSENAAGAPFLVQGQHNYHFGWHNIGEKKRYKSHEALKPLSSLNPKPSGVLVVRSKGDYLLTDADLDKGLEPCSTINVHWGGEGGSRDVKGWSEGCQVITGIGYLNHHNEPIVCSKFAASNAETLGNGKTKGAYNVLSDVVAALSSETDSVVKYMLLAEEDLTLSPEVSSMIENARAIARAQFVR